MSTITDAATFVVTHADALWKVGALVMIGLHYLAQRGLVKASVVQQIDALYADGVRFAQQWKRLQEKSGKEILDDMVREKAVGYISSRLQKYGVESVDVSKLEATVFQVKHEKGTAVKIQTPERDPKTGKYTKAQ